ncbi:hypothetical protein ACHAWF_003050 [Thalassiosira exigua]
MAHVLLRCASLEPPPTPSTSSMPSFSINSTQSKKNHGVPSDHETCTTHQFKMRLVRVTIVLKLLPIPFLAFHRQPCCDGFATPARAPVTSSSSTPSSVLSSTASDEGRDEGTTDKAPFPFLNPNDKNSNRNVDEARRARSLVRRDRLAQWRAAVTEVEDAVRDQEDRYFLAYAFLPAVLAFLSWGKVSIFVSIFFDTVGVNLNTPEATSFANNLLRPTIVGVVVPVIAVALGTLISTTVNVLRQRQVDLRAFINQEAGELRFLRRAVFGMYGTRQHAGRRARALALTCGYVERLMGECEDGAVGRLKEVELSGGIAANELDRFAAMLHGVDGAAASRQGSVHNADNLTMSLNTLRSKRVALLLTDFPVLHWDILFGLYLSVVIAFLLTSNQPVLQYLSSIQLRFMFALIIGVASGTAVLCWDLDNPFSGTFSIASASTQLADFRVCLREDIREALEESDEVSSSTRNFFQYQLGGPDTTKSRDGGNEDLPSSSRYGLLSTIYFHLLTGPLGPNIRFIGDAIAWLTTFLRRKVLVRLGRRAKAIVKWRRWPWQT